MIDLFINWNVDPEAISLGFLNIRWYGLLFGCAFIFSWLAFKELLKYDKIPIDFCDRTLIYLIVGTVIGARLGDCFFYHPMYYLEHPFEVFAIWRGGLSSHGGTIGILVALYLLSKKEKRSYIWIIDRLVVVVGVAAFFIRLGNLMNSEIYGHTTSLPWGFIFERNGETEPKHPTQIYEALFYAFVYFFLRFVYRKSDNRPRPFLIIGLAMILIFGYRFCIEFIKNPQENFEENMFLNMGQILSLPFILFGVISLIISTKQTRPAENTIYTQAQIDAQKKSPKRKK